MKRIINIILILALLTFIVNVNAEVINNYEDITLGDSIEKTNNITYYRFETTENGIVSFDGFDDGSNSGIYSYKMTLFNSDYESILNYPMLTSATPFSKILNSGTYYIKIEGSGTLRFKSHFRKYEFNNSNITSSSENPYKYSYEEEIYSNVNHDKNDYYELNVDITGDFILDSVCENDKLYFNIYDTNSDLVLSIKQGNLENSNSFVLEAGKYLLKVGTSNNINSNYSFAIEKTKDYDINISEPNNNFDNASVIDKVIHGVISNNNELDYLKFYIEKDAKIFINFESYEDFHIELYNENKEKVQSWVDTSYLQNNNSVILGKGTYYFKISKYINYGYYVLSLGDNETPIKLYKPIYDYKAVLDSQEGTTAWSTSVTANIPFTYYRDAEYFEIYMSEKKDGKYKLVGTRLNDPEDSYMYNRNFTIKKLKKNKGYYVKIRLIKYINGAKAYTEYSNIRKYYTAIKKKVTVTKNTMSEFRWKKVSGATGYVISEKYFHYLGVNVFFQDIDYHGEVSLLKKQSTTKYKRRYKNEYKNGKKTKSTVKIKAYTKHGSLYFVEGERITSDKSKYVYTKGTKYVGGVAL